MLLNNFDYHLPKGLIAQLPLKQRDNSRLVVLHRKNGRIEHKRFSQITEYLREGDVLVLNNTRVIPARLYGKKDTGGKIEVLLLSRVKEEDNLWECLINSHKATKPSQKILFNGCLSGELREKLGEGRFTIRFYSEDTFEDILEKVGTTPLPPYIKRDGAKNGLDRERYQTVYAQKRGAVAAPTAGLHFTEELIRSIQKKRVRIGFITLHVGWGTFQPVRVQRVEEHTMHPEEYEVGQEVADLVNQAKEEGRRVISVGTTSTRVLEFATQGGKLYAGKGMCDLFIYPGYRFKVVDALITNFHLPKSTLILLVSAFASRDFILSAYQEAMEKGYRFYSYGDAMMII
jgi:S-adenosylmethionine:tRNA ribosyltransferase-isomerase